MLLSAIFAAIVLQASPQTPPDTNSRATSRDTLRLNSIVVREAANRGHRYSAPWSATVLKVSTPLRDTPLSVSVLTRALIREQSMLSMADALRYVPGMTMG